MLPTAIRQACQYISISLSCPSHTGGGQDLAGLSERTGLDGFGLGGPEFVFGHEDLLYIGILVRQLVRTRFKALRSGRSRCEDQRQKRRDLFA